MNIKNPLQRLPDFVKLKPHLIKLDIDGTSTLGDYVTLNPRLKILAEQMIEDGHYFCFTTGRNYLGALKIYKEMGLNTYLFTYNGAYFYNPCLPAKTGSKFDLKNEIVKKILQEPCIKENLVNVLIDRYDLMTISTSDEPFYKNIFFRGNPYLKGDILELLGDYDVLQLVLEFPNDKKIEHDVLTILDSKYSAAISFYQGHSFKSDPKKSASNVLVPNHNRFTVKIRSKFASKATGALFASSHYNIETENVIAFGDNLNDIELLKIVGLGVATADSHELVKESAKDITKYGVSNSDGVVDFLAKHFGYKEPDYPKIDNKNNKA